MNQGAGLRYARYVLAVMVAINFLNYMDRWVASAASPLIQKEFGLSSATMGGLTSVALIAGAIGFPYARRRVASAPPAQLTADEEARINALLDKS